MPNATSSSFNAANQRLTGLRDGRPGGLATGDEAAGDGVTLWTSGFCRTVLQDDIREVKGYSSTTFVRTIGADGALNDGMVLGSSFSVSSADVNGDGVGQSKIDVSTVQFSVYMKLKPATFL